MDIIPHCQDSEDSWGLSWHCFYCCVAPKQALTFPNELDSNGGVFSLLYLAIYSIWSFTERKNIFFQIGKRRVCELLWLTVFSRMSQLAWFLPLCLWNLEDCVFQPKSVRLFSSHILPLLSWISLCNTFSTTADWHVFSNLFFDYFCDMLFWSFFQWAPVYHSAKVIAY